MDNAEKILYRLGYYATDTLKKEEVQEYMNEAVEYMRRAGVPETKLFSASSLAVQQIYAEERLKGGNKNILEKDGMIVALIIGLKR